VPRERNIDVDAPRRAPRADDGPRSRADNREPSRTPKAAPFSRDARKSPAQALAERIGERAPTRARPGPVRPEKGADARRDGRAGTRIDRSAETRAETRTGTGTERHDRRANGLPTRDTAAPRPAPRHEARDSRAAAHDDAGLMRLSKRMSELGLCSRREADEWIEKGWVRVDGEIIDTLGAKITAAQRIEVLPNARAAQARQVTIVLHKPVGYVSAQPEDDYPPAVTLITPANHWSEDPAPLRFSATHLRSLAPAGRLDIDSTGLLILTQDGRIAKQLIGEHSEVEKEYLVRVRFDAHEQDVDRHFPKERLAQLRHGLSLDGTELKPAHVEWQNGEQLRFVLREGRKRQIRRMCELVGLDVVGLKRVRMGNVVLGALPPGKWRYLSADERF
jgi:23S rRNA pseudouridine2604 synthase